MNLSISFLFLPTILATYSQLFAIFFYLTCGYCRTNRQSGGSPSHSQKSSRRFCHFLAFGLVFVVVNGAPTAGTADGADPIELTYSSASIEIRTSIGL